MAPIIKPSRDAELKLTAWAIATGGYPSGQEFSGLGLKFEWRKAIIATLPVILLAILLIIVTPWLVTFTPSLK